MVSISIQEIEQNMAAMPEDQRAIAEEAINMLSEEQIDVLLDVFGVDLLDEGGVAEEGEEELIPEDMPVDEDPLSETPAPVAEPTMEEAMAERPPPMATPIQEEMQALAFGDMVDPAAAQQMAVPPEMAGGEAPVDPDAMDAELDEAFNGQMAGPIQQEGASETGVADDVVVDEAKAGDYIINAAAVKRVGVQDLEERILEPAIKRLNKRGINITLASLKSPSDQIQNADDTENVDIAVSNGEYYIPDVLAGEIGYDLLDKINKRGEKETEEKLAEEAPPAEAAAAVEEEAPPEASAEQAMLQGFNSGSPGGVKKKVMNNQKTVADAVNKHFSKKLLPSAFPAIMGNIYKESNFNHKAKQTGGDAVGLLQMEPKMRADYKLFLKEKRIVDSIDSEIMYLKEALTTGRHIGGENAKRILNAFKKQSSRTNIKSATTTLMGYKGQTGKRGFFNPGKPHEQERINHALGYSPLPRPKQKPQPTPPPTQDQSFMNTAPAIGSPEDIEENRIADEQLIAATEKAATQLTATR